MVHLELGTHQFVRTSAKLGKKVTPRKYGISTGILMCFSYISCVLKQPRHMLLWENYLCLFIVPSSFLGTKAVPLSKSLEYKLTDARTWVL